MVKVRFVAVPIVFILCLMVTFQTGKAVYSDESECLPGSVSYETKSNADVELLPQEASVLNKDEVRSGEVTTSRLKSEKITSEQVSRQWTSVVSFAGMVDYSVMTDTLNKDKIDVNDMKHLPVYKIDTEQEMEKFKLMYCDENLIKRSYDELPSFEDATSGYDEEFFENYSLLIVYMTSCSGSLRFDVGDIDFNGDSICVYVEQINNPLVCTDDAPSWFVTVIIEDNKICDCKYFDAVFCL